MFESKATNIHSVFTEPQNLLVWKRPLRSSPTIITQPLPSPPLNHDPKCHIYTSFKSPRAWWLSHFLGQPVPVLRKCFGKEIFLIANLNLPWHILSLLALVLLLITWEKRMMPTSLKPSRLLERSISIIIQLIEGFFVALWSDYFFFLLLSMKSPDFSFYWQTRLAAQRGVCAILFRGLTLLGGSCVEGKKSETSVIFSKMSWKFM